MNVLLLTQVLPYPPDSGPKVKTWNVLKYLAQRHRVTLVSFVRGDQREDIRVLEKLCAGGVYTVPMERSKLRDTWYMLRSLFTGQPFLMVRDDRAAMRRLVDRLAAEQHFDVAHADQLNMAQYAARVLGAVKLLDAHNALWLLYKRLWETMHAGPQKWLLGRDWRLLKKYEGRICREFDAVLAVSEEDKAALSEAAGQPVTATVIPITVDTNEVTVVDRPNPTHVLHIGTMYWPPNIDGVLWFIREVWPLIREQKPDAQFDVVGSRPPQEIMTLSGDETGINVTGYVPDPTPYLQRAALMVVPLRAGGGMRVKILNALAQGIPIVSTTIGYEGIAVTPGENILVGDTPAEFADAVVQLLDDGELAQRIARNGRRLAEEVYDYRRACVPIDNVYRRSVGVKRET
ncbi:MAG: glycosyltransferase family 4 protein [Anaerolineae bacterium]|jgi:glycosyltransferase involved in cell wall biosynthesis|nr:glycosyltransferase family 4 protein [Anaerolineae bacterium]MDH7473305.1 glycosyltransferase [Anaerolineae bacterium]